MTRPAIPALLLSLASAGHAAEPALPAELAGVTILGTDYGEVTLDNGVWEGPPWAEGGASRPRVGLSRDFVRRGDIDGDGRDEWLLLVWSSSGGSGTFNYIALIDDTTDGPRNTATTPLGDRVKALDGGMAPGQAWVEVLEHDADDAACCPTRRALRYYDSTLQPVDRHKRETE